jgi:REP-associated tyrosine transposase
MFLAAEDYAFFRECLLSATRRFECAIHAYVFMTNHVHLLMSSCYPGGIGRVMQSVGRRYVRRFNDRHERTGTLWEGRYRATIIDTDDYLFACCRYIELNPVRAHLVRSPAEHPWSSYGANALGSIDSLVTPHDRYLALGTSPASRQAVYRDFFLTPLEERALHVIRDATNNAWALGSAEFRREISQTSRRAGPLPTGRRRGTTFAQEVRANPNSG